MNFTPDPKKILLIKLGAVGDLVMSSAFFHQLRKKFPDSEIVLLTGYVGCEISRSNPNLDRLILTDESALYTGASSRLFELMVLVHRLKKEHFDMVFVLHRAWPFNVLAFLARIPVRVGFGRGHEGIFLTHKVSIVPGRNERELYLDLLRSLGSKVQFERTFYYHSQEEMDLIPLFMERYQIGDQDRIVVVAPGGGDNIKTSMPIKRWPIKNFIALIKRILREGPYRVVLMGGEKDQNLTESIIEECPECIDTTEMSFGDNAAILSKSSLFIGNDSGPLHMAASMDIPTIGIYGPTEPKEWAPVEHNCHIFFKKVECGPCFKDGSFPRCDHLTCLNLITVDEVWQKTREILRSLEAPKPASIG